MNTRIKQLRQEKRYTQESLALKVGVNQTTLSRIECGVTIPDAYLLVRLSDTFKVSIDYILGISNHRPLPSILPEETGLLSKDADFINTAYQNS